MLPLALLILHTPCLHRWQRAGVQRQCAELRRLQWRPAVAAAHVMMVVLVLLVLGWHAHLHLQGAHLNLRRYHLRRQPVELRVVHWGYRANPLPGVPARHGMHAAEEETALHLLLLLPHGHRLRLHVERAVVGWSTGK